MFRYKISAGRAVLYYGILGIFVLGINTFIMVAYGREVFVELMLFTIAIPYFVMLLVISKDTLSQSFFNVWLWINIFIFLNNTSIALNEFIFKNSYVHFVLRMVLLISYCIVYNKYFKSFHVKLLEQPNINWWIFSLIPLLFTVLLWFVVTGHRAPATFSRNYPALLVVFVLMGFVYSSIIYIFKQANETADSKMLSHTFKEQVFLQKKQYANYLKKIEADNIFRHDQRFQDSILLSLLEDNDIEEAKRMVRRNQEMVDNRSVIIFCKNPIINAVLTEYKTQAEEKGIDFDALVKIPETLVCGEVEFCVALSNLLENAIDSANKYIKISIKHANNYLLLNVKNDYNHELKKKDTRHYSTTKESGLGLGLRSVEYMTKRYDGYFEIKDDNNEFDVYLAIKDIKKSDY